MNNTKPKIIIEYCYIFLGYLGAYLVFRTSIKYFYHFCYYLFSSRKICSPYIKHSLNNQGDFKITENYVLFNWNILNEKKRGGLNLNFKDTVTQFLDEGFKILILIDRKDKKNCLEDRCSYLNGYEEDFKERVIVKTINTISYETEYDSSNSYSHKLKTKLKEYNCFNKNISIFVNYMRNEIEENLEKQIIMAKVVIEKMSLNRGQSLIIGIATNYKSSFYKFVKNFHNILYCEYKNKIDIIFLKNKTEENKLDLQIDFKNIINKYQNRKNYIIT